MKSTSDKELATLYLGTVVGTEDIDYASILLRVYDDGFLTSSGFYKEILLPPEPVSIEDTKDTVLMHAVAATELPVDYQNLPVIFANEKEVLIEADDYITLLLVSGEEPFSTGVIKHLHTVDLEAVEQLIDEDRPEIKSPDMKWPVYIDEQGHGYSWLLIINCLTE